MRNPDWRDLVKEGFEYDLYANSLWLPHILTADLPEETAIFKHILSASTIWAKRLDGVSLPAMPDVPVSEETLIDLGARWLVAVDDFQFDQVISYMNTRGEPFSSTFGAIARHVVNHGTYHRGQLRSMYGARSLDFPETDYIGFIWKRKGKM